LPSSGGQYIWVGALAPRPCRHFLSYITGKPLFSLYRPLFTLSIGWLCVITWQTGLAGGAYVAASLVQGLFVLNIHTYEYKSWHTALLTLVFILAAIFFNTLLARHLPIMEGIFVILHILGGVTVFIPLWFLLPIAKGASPLVDFSNLAGWQTTGLSVIVGVIGPMAAATGFDCSTHMGMLSLLLFPDLFLPISRIAEETKDSSRTVPRTLLFGYMANIILGLFALLTW
jgi:amino acid transporter